MEDIKKEIEEISEKDLEEVAGGIRPIWAGKDSLCPKCGTGNNITKGGKRVCNDCGYVGEPSEFFGY